MKLILLLATVLLSGCVPNTKSDPVTYDYSDVETQIIDWCDIFSQLEDNYSVYFYSVTCGHCAEIKQSILSYYFLNKEVMYFSRTSEETVFGTKTDLIGVSDLEDFHIFGTPFLINVTNHTVSNYYAGVSEITNYIEKNTKQKIL